MSRDQTLTMSSARRSASAGVFGTEEDGGPGGIGVIGHGLFGRVAVVIDVGAVALHGERVGIAQGTVEPYDGALDLAQVGRVRLGLRGLIIIVATYCRRGEARAVLLVRNGACAQVERDLAA